MPNKVRLLRERQETYYELLKKEKRSTRTLDNYRSVLGRCFEELEKEGLEISPRKVSEREIDHLRGGALTGSDKYVRWQLSVFGNFLEWNGNSVVDRMRIGWPNDGRTNAHWLEDDEAAALENVAEGIERVVVHLEMCLLMRRVEVYRSKVQHFHGNTVDIHGKGRQLGKWRTIHNHHKTKDIVGEWLLVRDRIVSNYLRRHPKGFVPDALLIYERGGKLRPYSISGVDNIMKGLRLKMEAVYGRKVHFGNHDLRRTGGRRLWLANVKLETVAAMLGHSDVRTTIRYLGLNIDDQAEAQDKVRQYEEKHVCPTNGILKAKPECPGTTNIYMTLYCHAGSGEQLTVVSMDDVVMALRNTLGKKGMAESDIKRLAEYLMSFFGYTSEVIDNRLTSEDRDVFYMLEEEGLLTTTQEEVHLKKGKLWRIHYWILKNDQILRLARQNEEAQKRVDDTSAIYDEISEEVWNRE